MHSAFYQILWKMQKYKKVLRAGTQAVGSMAKIFSRVLIKYWDRANTTSYPVPKAGAFSHRPVPQPHTDHPSQNWIALILSELLDSSI